MSYSTDPILQVRMNEFLDEVYRDAQKELTNFDTASMIETVTYNHYIEKRFDFGPHNSAFNMTALLKDLKQLDAAYYNRVSELAITML